MRGKIDIHGRTVTGPVRDNNEDQFLIANLVKSMRLHQTSLSFDNDEAVFGSSQGQLMLVADGMGGQAAGEYASRIVVDTVKNYVLNTMPWFLCLDGGEACDFEREMEHALDACQEKLRQDVEQNPEHDGMGTTLTLGYLVWPKLYVVHAGDSRCYLHRDGQLHQVTTDHTLAQEMFERGELSEEEARTSRWGHVLSNVVGGSRDILRPAVYRVNLEVGDGLLFCTDGLSGPLSDDDMAAIIRREPDASSACDALINAAVAGGTKDNVTAIVCRFVDQMPEPDLKVDAAELPGRLDEPTTLVEIPTAKQIEAGLPEG